MNQHTNPSTRSRSSSSNLMLFLFLTSWCLILDTAEGRYMSRFGAGLGDATNPLGCSAAPSLRVLKYLDRICEDCYMIYRDTDVYQMCRSNCYNNNFFLGCMDVMMVSKVTRSKAANFVNKINTYTSRR